MAPTTPHRRRPGSRSSAGVARTMPARVDAYRRGRRTRCSTCAGCTGVQRLAGRAVTPPRDGGWAGADHPARRLARGRDCPRRAVADALDGGPAVLPWAAAPVRASPARRGGPSDDPDRPGDGVLVATSGSTGLPRLVVLPAAALRASADATAARLGGPGRWLLALPADHVAGVQVVVRALLAGAAPVVQDLRGGFRPDGFAAATAAARPRPAVHEPRTHPAPAPARRRRFRAGGAARLRRRARRRRRPRRRAAGARRGGRRADRHDLRHDRDGRGLRLRRAAARRRAGPRSDADGPRR